MKKLSAWMLGAVLSLVLCGGISAQEEIFFTPDSIPWGPGPASLPPGAQMAVLEGAPAKPGPFTIRLKFPPHYNVQPHWHPAPEHVTVLSGALSLAMGDVFDTTKEKKVLSAGGFRVMPATAHHFGWTTTEETIIQLHGVGPWEINYLNSSDDPRQSKK